MQQTDVLGCVVFEAGEGKRRTLFTSHAILVLRYNKLSCTHAAHYPVLI